MPRDPGLARDKPLRRSQIEETITVKQAAKRPAPKNARKDVFPPKNKRKSNATHRKPAKKPRMSTREFCERDTTHLMLLILIQVNIPIPDGLSDTASNASSSKNASDKQREVEIVGIEKLDPSACLSPPRSPSAPKLPLLELVIIFIINGKEIGERSREMDPNEDFGSFDFQLTNLVLPKLPKGLTARSDGVNVSYQRAYITKAQERKRKDLPWKEFADNDDYLGLVNAIRSCPKPYTMTVMIRAFITVPKENFDVEIEPIIASQRLVHSSSITLKLTV